MKTCKKCGESKDEELFYRRRDTGRLHTQCRACLAVSQKVYEKANRDKVRARHRANLLKTRYGITSEEYERILHRQGGACALCFQEPPPGKHLHVDHDHTTGKIRGLLCYTCNAGIGYLKDNTDRLLRAAEYVDTKEPFFVEGFLNLTMRERGKLVPDGQRAGANIWTLTGREYLAQLMSLSAPATPYRTDHIFYVGFGRGNQKEVASIDHLVTPLPYNADGDFLAPLAFPTFPLSPTRTTVQYSRSYSELQLSMTGSVSLTEAGLYSDGNPDNNWATRVIPDDLRLSAARLQPPMAYKSFEVLKKTQNFVLEVAWQVRF